MSSYSGRRVASLRAMVWAAFPHVCIYCGVKLTPATFTVEHKLPRSRGGSDDLANLAPACRHCNFSRGNRAVTPRRAEDGRAFFAG